LPDGLDPGGDPPGVVDRVGGAQRLVQRRE
jgi:hypothetical protein